jgi:prevent-host-death family protein
MKSVNIHEAKTHLSRLVQQAARGEPFIIAKAGKPLVKVVPLDAPEERAKPRRFGFMKGQFTVPDDFDTFMQDEIIAMFEEGPLFPPLDADEKSSEGR